MRLTKKQIADYKQKLAVWLPPAAMRTQAKEIMYLTGNEDFFNQPDLDFAREAWVAGEFGEKRGAVAARLVNISEARPDFALQLEGGETELYELVEADRVDRKRGAEYLALAAAGNPTYAWPVEEWATPDQARAAILRSAKKKATRAETLAKKGTPYPPDTKLLFYVNLSDFGTNTDEILGIFPTAAELARAWFPSIWVLWKNRAYQV